MPVRGQPNLGANFYPKLVQIASELKMKPEDILAVMTSESGLNPSAYEAKYKASGLIGFMPDTLRGLGFRGSWRDFTNLSGEQQLDYVKKFIQGKRSLMGGKPFTSAGQYYTANLWPIAFKLPGVQQGNLDTRILESHPQTDTSGKYSKKYLDVGQKISAKFESKAYGANTLFDHDKKGYITYGDMVKQTQMNRKNPIYQKAVAQMAKSTGYQAGHAPSMVAHNDNVRAPDKEEDVLNSFLQMLSAASDEYSLKKLYKNALPNHDILIQVSAPDHTTAVEFSRILCAALDEELLSTSYTFTDGHQVEIECSIPGPPQDCFATVKQLSEAVAEVFKDATKKVGGLTVETQCIMNKKSFYQPLSLRMASTNYRKFLLRFI